MGAILIAGGVVRNWKQYQQYAPLPGLYLMVTFLIGYSFTSHIGRGYDFDAWIVWMIVTYVPLDWVSTRVGRSEPWP